MVEQHPHMGDFYLPARTAVDYTPTLRTLLVERTERI
jgi:hypothetical protein